MSELRKKWRGLAKRADNCRWSMEVLALRLQELADAEKNKEIEAAIRWAYDLGREDGKKNDRRFSVLGAYQAWKEKT